MILKQIADVDFPTRWAHFRLLAFDALRSSGAPLREWRESALALILGDLQRESPLVRIHSQCTTGEVFHSLRCDCRDQLQMALRAIAREGNGVLIYEQQEGRGIGLMEKLRAYELQDHGLDTIDANLRLGHAVDARDYALAVSILEFLGIRSLRLISNNPQKIDAVVSSGIRLAERVPADVPGNPYSSRYLATKRERLRHFSMTAPDLPVAAAEPLDGLCRSQAGTESRGALWPMS
ncbi:MAG TPA: GTP cyclohydrolase II [Acidobacteriaceae bacterium]|nr:GTP cyclohydrolase II [Acidobacteriaceae bacterium]